MLIKSRLAACFLPAWLLAVAGPAAAPRAANSAVLQAAGMAWCAKGAL